MFGNKRNLIFIILVFIGATVFFVVRSMNSSGFMPFKVENNSLVISGSSNYSFVIPISDIDKAELIEINEAGECLEDHSTKNYICGTYNNGTYGKCEVCLLKKIKSAVAVTCRDGRVYIFNYESARSTSELYKAILEYKATAQEE